MTDLQTATDIVAIAFMGLVTLVLLVGIIAALAIKRKVSKAQQNVRSKIELVRNLPFIGREVFHAARRAAHH